MALKLPIENLRLLVYCMTALIFYKIDYIFCLFQLEEYDKLDLFSKVKDLNQLLQSKEAEIGEKF